MKDMQSNNSTAFSLDDDNDDEDDPNKNIEIMGNDSVKFQVSKSAATVSQVVKSALSKDPDETLLAFPSIESKTLKFLIDFMLIYHKETEHIATRWIENLTLTPKDMQTSISACFYMDIPFLQELIINKFVKFMKGKTYTEIMQIRGILSNQMDLVISQWLNFFFGNVDGLYTKLLTCSMPIFACYQMTVSKTTVDRLIILQHQK